MDKINVYSVYGMKGGEKSIMVSGHVKKPGEYPLSQNMKLSHIIFAVGGFEDNDFKRDTYLQQSHLIRYDKDSTQKKIISFDLEKLLEGGSPEDIFLQSGDEVRIYPSKMFQDEKVVEIIGAVRMQGSYEYFKDMSLLDLINVAGGLSETADTDKAEIVKVLTLNPGSGRESYIKSINYANLSESSEIKLSNRDVVYIRKNPKFRQISRVRIEGLVKFPGEYILKSEDETLSDIIRRAGGILPAGFAEGAVLERGGEKMIINFRKAIKKPKSEYDPVLKRDDKIFVPEKDYRIQIAGAVAMEKIDIQYLPGRDVDFYVEAAGGYTENADINKVRIMLPGGRSIKARGVFFDPSVVMGSKIIVPAKAKRGSAGF